MSANYECMSLLLSHGADVNAGDARGQCTPLLSLLGRSWRQNPSWDSIALCFDALVEAGADVRFQDRFGTRALDSLSECPYAGRSTRYILGRLLEMGASLEDMVCRYGS